jgi:hypothetical protein
VRVAEAQDGREKGVEWWQSVSTVEGIARSKN